MWIFLAALMVPPYVMRVMATMSGGDGYGLTREREAGRVGRLRRDKGITEMTFGRCLFEYLVK